MSQLIYQDSHAECTNVNKPYTLFLANRQELLQWLDGLTGCSGEPAGHHRFFSGHSQPK